MTDDKPKAIKHDQEKLRMDLIKPEFLESLARGLTYGAGKYGSDNYLRGDGLDPDRVYAALMRHIQAQRRGEKIDAESGLSIADHINSCCMMWYQLLLKRGLV